VPAFAGVATVRSEAFRRHTVERRSIGCYAANSTVVFDACNCFGVPRHPLYETRPVVVVVVGSWLGAEIDAWLIKTIVEEVLGFPTELVSDGLSDVSSLNLTGPEGVWNAMANAVVHMYPEVRLHKILCSGSVHNTLLQ
jgi:hypothetical protein